MATKEQVSSVMHVRCLDRLPEEAYRRVLEELAGLSPVVQALPPSAARGAEGSAALSRDLVVQLGALLRRRGQAARALTLTPTS